MLSTRGSARVRGVFPRRAARNRFFFLGDGEPGYFHELSPGDFVEVVQETDLTGVDFVRAEMTLRVPDGLPAGLAWEVSIVADGEKVAGVVCSRGRNRRIVDLAANVSKISAMKPVGIRITLIEAEE